jgi:hypothetical protein
MVDINSIGSSPSLDPWARTLDDDEERRRASARPGPAATRDVSELPELPDASAAAFARATKAAATPHPLLATGLSSADAAPCVDSAATPTPPAQGRLDAFMAAARPTYHIPGEQDVAVAAPFRMMSKVQLTEQEKCDPVMVRYAEQEKRVENNFQDLADIAATKGISSAQLEGLILRGRGTPEQVYALAQELIDKHKLPPPDGVHTAEQRVRQMMCDYGLGFDCAGYTQQAFLAAHGLTRAQAGFAPSIGDEGLFAPAAHGRFSRVAPENAGPGDLIVLGPPPGETYGHRLVVYDRHDLQPTELAAFHGRPEDMERLRAGRISVLQVDSSWGSAADPDQGGVERRTWLYDATSKQWGRVLPDNTVRFTQSGLPYDGFHPLRGVYHYPEAR